MRETTYVGAGVNIELGDDASKVLYEAAKLTWNNRKGNLGEVIEIFEDFSGLRGINVGELPRNTFMNLNFDGIGTKVEIAQRMERHDTVAYDLFAMVCDDAVVRGAEPVLVGSILDVRSLGERGESYLQLVKDLARGYIGAAKAANVAVINGEIAELGASITGYLKPSKFSDRVVSSLRYLLHAEIPTTQGFHYNWGAGVVWFASKDKLISGQNIRVGDMLVGLREEGFRANGLSLVRKVMKNTHGEKWHETSYQGIRLGELVLHPSTIYSKAVVEMFGGFRGEPKAEIHGVAHITGGGIPEKLRRILKPSGLGAYLNNPFTPYELMHYCQEKGRVKDEEAYRTWNMGQGMILITPTPSPLIEVARRHNLEARVIGEVTSDLHIRITNRGLYRHRQRELIF